MQPGLGDSTSEQGVMQWFYKKASIFILITDSPEKHQPIFSKASQGSMKIDYICG